MRDKTQKPIQDGDLITTESTAVEKYDDKAFELATKAGDFLPRLQLMTSNAAKCKDNEFPINHYALVRGKDFQDLGESVDVLVVRWRPKALEIGDNVIAVHDPDDAEFTRIMEKSSQQNSGCMYGPEFLLYIPAVEAWLTFFMGSKSARNEAGPMRTQLKKAATLKAQKISTKKYTWYAPQVLPCSTPFELPDAADIAEQVAKFDNPPKSDLETDTDEGTGREV